MRQFYLEDTIGNRFSLMDECFFNLPEGLGLGYDISYSRVGDNFVPTQSFLQQKQITGTIIFLKDYYKNYQEFVNFVAKNNNELKLIYILETEYVIDVDVTNISKGDSKGFKHLECSVTFTTKSTYYRKIPLKYVIDNSVVQNRFPSRWNVTINDSVEGQVDIEIKGTNQSAFSMIINGASSRPAIKIISNDTVREINFNVDISSTQKLYYSTSDNDTYCYIQNQDGSIENIIDKLDYRNNNFPKLQAGLNTIKGININEASITVLDSYVAV